MNKSFLSASAELGNNFNLIQGAGGNTSYKEGNSLFVKASGYKLKDCLKNNIFVKVNLKKVRESLRQNKINPLAGAWDQSSGKKPSMETNMHAILPQKYIFHVHCLNTISCVVQEDYELKIARLFKDLKYSIIKYKTPGIPLANEIKKKIKEDKPEILFLENHGLVVASDNVEKALELTYYVSKKLELPSEDSYKEDLEKLQDFAVGSCFRPIKYHHANNIAFSNHQTKIVSLGSLYPDHVVFVGTKTYILKNKSDLNKIEINTKTDQKLPIMIVPYAGLLVPYNISFEAEELILALSKIVSKIPKNKKIKYLNDSEVYELENSNSEIYRLSLNTKN